MTLNQRNARAQDKRGLDARKSRLLPVRKTRKIGSVQTKAKIQVQPTQPMTPLKTAAKTFEQTKIDRTKSKRKPQNLSTPPKPGHSGGDTRTVVVERSPATASCSDGDDIIIASCAQKAANQQAYLRSLEAETQGLLVSRILAQHRANQRATSTVKLPKSEYEKLLYYKQQCLELAAENQQLRVKYDEMIAMS